MLFRSILGSFRVLQNLRQQSHAEAGRVRFGACVRVRGDRTGAAEYRIVGADETDLDRGWVSWMSPN